MLKSIKIVFTLSMFLVSIPSFAWQFGSGTASDPYQIWNKDDLQALADSVNNSVLLNGFRHNHLILMADITDTLKTRIGHNNNFARNRFNNHFNGNGYKITLSAIGGARLGLFGFVGEDAVIENLTVDGIVSGEHDIGGIAGVNLGGTIQNCTNYASVSYSTSTGAWIGGICGDNGGHVLNCVNNGSVTGFFYVGGIVGVNGSGVHSSVSIVNCINTATIKGQYEIAGIVGSSARSIIKDCINIGTVEGNSRVGGIAARLVVSADYSPLTTDNINYGFIYGSNEIGGIVGVVVGNYNTTISNNFNAGVVSGNSKVGCIVGANETPNATLINNHYDKQMCGEPEPSELGE